jgi:peptidoglycan/xylan/chitin deacetylase (PgdA/CDA1 family)
MISVSSPFILKKIAPAALNWVVKTREKEIFLTFDDGPFPGVTDNILHLLDAYNAKATFFCTGRQAQRHPRFIDMIKDRGHSLGNHTFNHISGWGNSAKNYINDINLCNDVFQSNLFRPPYGRIMPGQVKMLKNRFNIIMWTQITHDYKKEIISSEKISKLKTTVIPGSIILMHDSEKAAKNVIVILKNLLEYFSDKGYCFCNLEKAFPANESL